jgi:hypothetical protein
LLLQVKLGTSAVEKAKAGININEQEVLVGKFLGME